MCLDWGIHLHCRAGNHREQGLLHDGRHRRCREPWTRELRTHMIPIRNVPTNKSIVIKTPTHSYHAQNPCFYVVWTCCSECHKYSRVWDMLLWVPEQWCYRGRWCNSRCLMKERMERVVQNLIINKCLRSITTPNQFWEYLSQIDALIK